MSPLIFAYLALASALASGVLALGADRYPVLLRYGSSIFLGVCGVFAVFAGAWALIDEAPTTDLLALGLIREQPRALLGTTGSRRCSS